MDQDERLPGEIARRNWIILGGLLLVSLPWHSHQVTLGVLAGGLVAIIGFRWMHLSLHRALAEPSKGAAKRFQRSYLLRLGALGATLFLLIGPVGVNPVGLAIGLSVVVVNILWTTIKRTF